jgi:hypothetical protein
MCVCVRILCVCVCGRGCPRAPVCVCARAQVKGIARARAKRAQAAGDEEDSQVPLFVVRLVKLIAGRVLRAPGGSRCAQIPPHFAWLHVDLSGVLQGVDSNKRRRDVRSSLLCYSVRA